MGVFIDLSGMRFGRLTVIKRAATGPATNGKRVVWKCVCDCGSFHEAKARDLRGGEVKSCGCLKIDTGAAMKAAHGHAGGKRKSPTATYYSWQAAKSRCGNPSHTKYPTYGAKGVTMCRRWESSFEAFLSDMGTRPKGKTLDRKDGRKGYSPSNCRWATPREQRLNQTRCHPPRGE